MRAAIVYNTRHESKNPCPLSQLSTLASPPRCSPEPSRCLARRGGQSARATCCCTQGLLDFLQTTLLRHRDRKSTRLNSSHVEISYAVFCLKKKNKNTKN